MVAPVLAWRSLQALVVVALAGVAPAGGGSTSAATAASLRIVAPQQEQAPARREFTVVGRRYSFTPDRIEVNQDDQVRITLAAEDIPHSFTIDAYRIAKRAAPGQSVTFEFRAERPGTFEFYCNLTTDDGCRRMRGQLIVSARPR